MDALLYLGVIFVVGALMQWLSPKIGLPEVVGYLLAGIVMGPEVLRIVPQSFVDASQIVIDIALAIIAVLVGATLKWGFLCAHAKEVILITLFQSLFSFMAVLLGFWFLGAWLGIEEAYRLSAALLLAAIATATDTASPMAIIRQLRAKGPFTSTFLAVIALDDALSLMMFALCVSLGSLLTGSIPFELFGMAESLGLIALSMLLGVCGALLNLLFERLCANNKAMETIATLGLVLIVYQQSRAWGLEPLLAAMAMGVVMSNGSRGFDLIHREIDEHLFNIILILFFILSAMHLKPAALLALPWMIAAYVLLRLAGKVLGANLGARSAHSLPFTRRYLGWALLPQAGISIGLVLSLQQNPLFAPVASMVLGVIIAATFIHELLGPLVVNYVLLRSQESDVRPDGED
ncbi:MAG: cation:proton antiporter [Campylobacterales bacterium]|nr:cation:proton antiporter [Campylobacterales bacterium]